MAPGPRARRPQGPAAPQIPFLIVLGSPWVNYNSSWMLFLLRFHYYPSRVINSEGGGLEKIAPIEVSSSNRNYAAKIPGGLRPPGTPAFKKEAPAGAKPKKKTKISKF